MTKGSNLSFEGYHWDREDEETKDSSPSIEGYHWDREEVVVVTKGSNPSIEENH